MDSSIYDFARNYIEQHPEWVTDRISGYEFGIFVMGSIIAILFTIIIIWLAILLIAQAVHNKKTEKSFYKWRFDDVPSAFAWMMIAALSGAAIIIMIPAIVFSNITICQLETDPVLCLASNIMNKSL